jgi:hypothetical protein
VTRNHVQWRTSELAMFRLLIHTVPRRFNQLKTFTGVGNLIVVTLHLSASLLMMVKLTQSCPGAISCTNGVEC